MGVETENCEIAAKRFENTFRAMGFRDFRSSRSRNTGGAFKGPYKSESSLITCEAELHGSVTRIVYSFLSLIGTSMICICTLQGLRRFSYAGSEGPRKMHCLPPICFSRENLIWWLERMTVTRKSTLCAKTTILDQLPSRGCCTLIWFGIPKIHFSVCSWPVTKYNVLCDSKSHFNR